MKKLRKIEIFLLIAIPIFFAFTYYFTFVLADWHLSGRFVMCGVFAAFLILVIEAARKDKVVIYNLKIVAEVIDAKIKDGISGRVLKGSYKGSPVIVRYDRGTFTIVKKVTTDDKSVWDFTLVQPTKNTYIEKGQVCWEDKYIFEEKLKKEKIISFFDELIQAAEIVTAHGPYYSRIK